MAEAGEAKAAGDLAIPADVLDRVRARLVADGGQISAAKVAAAVRAEGQLLGDAAILQACQTLRAQVSGAGPLEALLREPGVTDVLVNSPNEVWVDRGNGLEPASVSFADEQSVRRLAQRLAAAAGRRVDDASPCVDACLPDGSRLHAVLYPLARRGTCLSIRVPRARGFTLGRLVELGTLTEVGAAWLCAIVAARLAFLVTGGAGTGKTTLLSTLLGLVDPQERLILIEDSAELSPAHAHLVRLESRPANVEGIGQVSVRDLVRQALRMRPDRLVVGEVRGPEVVDLLAALNTGHEGGCGTVHANAAADLPARMEALGLAAGLNQAALHSQLAAGVRVILHLARSRDGLRRLTEICLLERGPTGLVRAVPAVSFAADGSAVAGPAREQLAELVDPRRGAR
jgi:pilus assembly protein CpaF